MTKEEFYKDKSEMYIQWWLSSCNFPELVWARLRVFNDSTADSCFGEGSTLYGFENQDYASYILSEDEYIRFEDIDLDDEEEYGITLSMVNPPKWNDTLAQDFEYLVTY